MSNDERPDSLAAQAAAWVPPWERPAREPDRAYQAAAEAAARGESADDNSDETDQSEETSSSPAEQSSLDTRLGPAEESSLDTRPGPAEENDLDTRPGLAEQHSPDTRPTPAGKIETGINGNGSGYGGGKDDRPDAADDRPDADADEAGGPEGAFEPSDQSESAAPAQDRPARARDGEAPEVPSDDNVTGIDAPVRDDRDGDPTDVPPGPELPVPGAIEEAAEPEEQDEGVPVDAPLPPGGDDAGEAFGQADDGFTDDTDAGASIPEAAGSGSAPTGSAADESGGSAANESSGTTPASEAAVGSRPAKPALEPAAGEGPVAELSETSGSDGDATADGRDKSGSKNGRKRPTRRADASAAVPAQASRAAELPVPASHADGRTEEGVDDLPPLMDEAELTAALEAILLVVDEPVGELQLAQILEQPTERIARTLDDISARYTAAGHGFDLRRAAGGWRLYTRPEYAAYVERFVLDGQSVRLTQAALETLAVVAYKQPVTRSRISAIRGVNCDGVMRTLVTRGLIEECGTEGETGAFLYRTTPLFLEKLGLNSIEQLPPLAPFLPDDVEEVLDASG